jgi:hypothetical protein
MTTLTHYRLLLAACCVILLCMYWQELSSLYEADRLDGFGLFMFGVVLKEMKVLR